MSSWPVAAPDGFYRTFSERIQAEVAAHARYAGSCLRCLRRGFLPEDIHGGRCPACRGSRELREEPPR